MSKIDKKYSVSSNPAVEFFRLVGPAKRAYYNYLYKLLLDKKITDKEHTKLLKLGQSIQAATTTWALTVK